MHVVMHVGKRIAFSLLLLGICAMTLAAQEEPAEPGMVWRWANFVILVIGLGYLISKAAPPFFQSRTKEIKQGILEAQQIKRDAEQRSAAMDAKLNALGAEIEAFRTQAHAEMEQEAARIREETARQIEKLQKQAEVEIETAGKVVRRELQRYSAKLALELAEQRIRARVDAAVESSLVEDFVEDLRKQGSRN
jgi:F0F1-type ATP synthase membrane subunit b/b'